VRPWNSKRAAPVAREAQSVGFERADDNHILNDTRTVPAGSWANKAEGRAATKTLANTNFMVPGTSDINCPTAMRFMEA